MDGVIATLDAALAKQGETVKSIETWKAEMPTEAEMLPRDKYTMFDRKEKRYRKGIHSEFLPFGLAVCGTPGNSVGALVTTRCWGNIPQEAWECLIFPGHWLI